MSGSISFSQDFQKYLDMINVSDTQIYLRMVDGFNLSHLIRDDKNLSHIQTVLENNFVWPPDMRQAVHC